MGRLNVFESILLFSVISLLVFPILYICRFLDNNTLVSWRWVFQSTPIALVITWMLASIVLSAFISLKFPLGKYSSPVLFFLGFLSILPLWSEPELLLDSGRYFLQAKYFSEYGASYFLREWGNEITAWTDLPLVPFLYGSIFKFAGETRVAVQAFNTILFGLTLVLTAKIGEELWDKEVGFYAGLILLGMPYLMTQVPLMLVDIPTLFFFFLAIYLFLLALSKGGRWVVLSAVTIVLTILCKYSIWLMLLILPLTALVIKSKDRRLTMTRAGVVFLCSALIAGLIIGLKFELFQIQLKTLTGYQKPALSLWQEGYLSTFFFQINPFISLLVIWAGYRAYQKGDRHILIAAFCIVLIVGLQIKRIRYIIPLLPLLALMASFGLQSIKEIHVRRFVGLVILSYSLIIINVGYIPFFKTTSMMNVMQAGQLLENLPGETVEIYTLPQSESGGNTALAIPQLDLFTNKKIVSRQEWVHADIEQQTPFAPLLFSWKVKRPPFYDSHREEENLPLLIIADTGLPTDSEELADVIGTRELRGMFTTESGVFRFRTKVYLFVDSCEYDLSDPNDSDVYCSGHPAIERWPIWDSSGSSRFRGV